MFVRLFLLLFLPLLIGQSSLRTHGISLFLLRLELLSLGLSNIVHTNPRGQDLIEQTPTTSTTIANPALVQARQRLS